MIFLVSTLGGTAPAGRWDQARRQPPRGHQEPGVSHHAVFGADGQAVHVPAAHEAFPDVGGDGSVVGPIDAILADLKRRTQGS